MKNGFSEKQVEYINAMIGSGDYHTFSVATNRDVGLHQLNREQIIANIKAEIDKGFDGETSSRSIEDILKSKLKDK